MSTGVQGQFNGPRSQLATNHFLLVLGQVFETATFTSSDVANRLGLDFLNTCKRLSRMSKQPYYSLSAVRFVRPCGWGFENSYRISSRGWRKIDYLQRHPAGAQKPVTGISMQKQWAARYLLKEKGGVYDSAENTYFNRLVAPKFQPVNTSLDEVDLLLLNFDLRVILTETLTGIRDETGKTALRVRCLQDKGLIPQDIDVPLFVVNAIQMGSSSQTILLALLLRGATKLRNELVALRESSPVNETAQTAALHTSSLHTSSPPPRTECKNCSHYKILLDLEKLESKLVELENSSLQKKLDEASLDSTLVSFRLNNRIIKYRNYIEMNTRCLAMVSEGLDRVIGKDPSIELLLVKSHINTALAGIMRLNIMA